MSIETPAAVLHRQAWPEPISVLVVSPFDNDHRSLNSIFKRLKWQAEFAYSSEEALECLAELGISIVICDTAAEPDGWRSAIELLHRLPKPPLVIVASRLAGDALWAEVLSHGGFDLIRKPFELSEVMWSVTSAWRRRSVRLPHVDLPPFASAAAYSVPLRNFLSNQAKKL